MRALGIMLAQQSQDDPTEFEKFAASVANCEVEIEEPCSSGKIKFYINTKCIAAVIFILFVLATVFLGKILSVFRTVYPGFSQSTTSIALTAANPKVPSYFNKAKATKIIIHGFLGSINSNDSYFIREAYRQRNTFNLVNVDWGELVKLPCYPTAVFSTWQAGKCTAAFLENFITDGNFKRVHAIGFSLGAHVAGFTSNLLKRKLSKQLGRVTGLDPALPFFASLESGMKLDKEDGDFVDLVHTNSGIFGKIEPTGHVDFYMNGGFYQPACQMAKNIPVCSHRMAVLYYAESVTRVTKGFWGVPCTSHFHYVIGFCSEANVKDRVLMGDKCDHKSRGIYFVSTRNEPPYALG